MSLARFAYYSSLVGGWAAFLGWFLSEILFHERLRSASEGIGGAVAIGSIVGATIGIGINLVAGMANAQWKQLALRILPGLVCGGIGGAIAAPIGQVLVHLVDFCELPNVFGSASQVLGWIILGLGIGVVDGLYEQSKVKIRNGLIGGGLGGLVGGLLFVIISAGATMSSRATGFVILGIAIGALIGLAQIVLREAWLTVVDGYRTGRQVILSQPITLLGRGEHLPLPFLGSMNKGIEVEHVKIIRLPSGSYVIEDNQTKLGTRLNNQPLTGRTALNDGDTIRFGTNFVRFERHRQGAKDGRIPNPASQTEIKSPPPPRKRNKMEMAAPSGSDSSTAESPPPTATGPAEAGKMVASVRHTPGTAGSSRPLPPQPRTAQPRVAPPPPPPRRKS